MLEKSHIGKEVKLTYDCPKPPIYKLLDVEIDRVRLENKAGDLRFWAPIARAVLI